MRLRLWDESSILMVWQHKILPTFDWPDSPPAPICDVAERHLELVLVKSIKESIKQYRQQSLTVALKGGPDPRLFTGPIIHL